MSEHFLKRKSPACEAKLILRPTDVVIMDWALSFTPNDIQDLTPRQAATRVNPKIVLSIRVGKGAVSKAIPVLLEDMSFTGRMRRVHCSRLVLTSGSSSG
jgi:Ca2+-dependent lipid-binding protein